MKIRTGDKVKIMSGKDKGKLGKVLRIFNKNNRVLVEGVNMVKKHVKPGTVSKEGGIVSVEKPISVSTVMYYNELLKRPVRVGYKVVDGKKVRICKKSGEKLGK